MSEITDPQEVQAKQQAIADRRAAKRQQITQEVTQQYSGFAVNDRSKKLRASIARRQSLIENLSEQIETAELYLSVMQTMLYEITSPISVGDLAYFRHTLVQVTGVTVKHSGDVIYKYRCILKNGRSSDDELDVTEDWFRLVSNLINTNGPTIHHQGRYLTWFAWGIAYYDEDTDAVSTFIKKRWQLRAFCAATAMPLREV